MSKEIHDKNWEEIIKLLKSEDNQDIHKFYSEKRGWVKLTDKYGGRHEVGYGSTVNDLRQAINNVRGINGYSPRGRRAYRYRTAPPLTQE